MFPRAAVELQGTPNWRKRGSPSHRRVWRMMSSSCAAMSTPERPSVAPVRLSRRLQPLRKTNGTHLFSEYLASLSAEESAILDELRLLDERFGAAPSKPEPACASHG